jgi:hypothetical protein
MQVIQDANPNLTGFFTFGDDMAGQLPSGAVIDRLRLDYDGSAFLAGETYVVVKTPMTDTLRNGAKIPRTPDYGSIGPYEAIEESGFPFTGHGLTASKDGHLARELKMTTNTPMEVNVSVTEFKNADGSARILQIGELSGHTWVLKHNGDNFYWYPLTN